jgi:hypothetical protein
VASKFCVSVTTTWPVADVVLSVSFGQKEDGVIAGCGVVVDLDKETAADLAQRILEVVKQVHEFEEDLNKLDARFEECQS